MHFDRDDLQRALGPRLGVVVRAMRGRDEPSGALILAVTPGSPADGAGLCSGDVITHVDGKELGSHSPAMALTRILAGLEDGDRVSLDHVRDGENLSTIAIVRLMDEVEQRPPIGGRWSLEIIDAFRPA